MNLNLIDSFNFHLLLFLFCVILVIRFAKQFVLCALQVVCKCDNHNTSVINIVIITSSSSNYNYSAYEKYSPPPFEVC